MSDTDNQTTHVLPTAPTQQGGNSSHSTDAAATAKPIIVVEEVEPGVFVRSSSTSKYIIEYRRDACIGAGSCAAIASFTFEMDDENKAVMLGVEDEDDDLILAAAQSCPVFAIIIKDKETGEQIFPPVD